MDQLTSEERASAYCRERCSVPDFGNLLGMGQEGSVWPTDNETAIKVFDGNETSIRKSVAMKSFGIIKSTRSTDSRSLT